MKNNNYINKEKIAKLFITAILVVVSLVLIITSFDFKKENNKKNSHYYNITKDVNYKVYLKENNFYDENYIDMDKVYVSSLTKSISLDFIYAFNLSKKQNNDYIYNIIATIYVDSANTNENLWEKNITLIDNKNTSFEDTGNVKIEEKVDIDFNLYNNMVKEFKKNLNTPTTSYMKIKFNVTNIKQEDESANTNTVIEAIMNLDQDTFKISKKTDSDENKLALESGKEDKNVNGFKLISGIIGLIVSVTMLLNIANKYCNNNRNKYKMSINKILKNYGDIVAEIIHPVNLDNMEIIDVRNFDQMLDVEEELRMPILYYEITKGEESCFVILHNNIAYRYILRNKNRKRS